MYSELLTMSAHRVTHHYILQFIIPVCMYDVHGHIFAILYLYTCTYYIYIYMCTCTNYIYTGKKLHIIFVSEYNFNSKGL